MSEGCHYFLKAWPSMDPLQQVFLKAPSTTAEP